MEIMVSLDANKKELGKGRLGVEHPYFKIYAFSNHNHTHKDYSTNVTVVGILAFISVVLDHDDVSSLQPISFTLQLADEILRACVTVCAVL
jgi:hypothetical protein